MFYGWRACTDSILEPLLPAQYTGNTEKTLEDPLSAPVIGTKTFSASLVLRKMFKFNKYGDKIRQIQTYIRRRETGCIQKSGSDTPVHLCLPGGLILLYIGKQTVSLWVVLSVRSYSPDRISEGLIFLSQPLSGNVLRVSFTNLTWWKSLWSQNTVNKEEKAWDMWLSLLPLCILNH